MNGRLKILALISLKFAIAVAFLIYLSQSIQWKELLFQFKAISYSTILILLVGSLLGCVIEGLRWKLHVADAAFDLKQAVRSVAMGLTVSVFMPGGSGGIASRVLQLPPKKADQRWKLVIQATFWQWSAIWHIGLFGYAFRVYLLGESPWFWLFLGFFSLSLANYFLGSKKVVSFQWLSYLASPSGGYALLYLSIFRYVIYGFVLWLAVWFTPSFVQLPLRLFLPLILLSFSLQFILPVLPLLEIGLRSSVMLWVFAPFMDSSSQIILWAFLLWFFNLIVPAILGLLFGWIWFWKS